MREGLKLQMMTLDVKKFNAEVRGFKDEKLFDPEFQRTELAKHK